MSSFQCSENYATPNEIEPSLGDAIRRYEPLLGDRLPLQVDIYLLLGKEGRKYLAVGDLLIASEMARYMLITTAQPPAPSVDVCGVATEHPTGSKAPGNAFKQQI